MHARAIACEKPCAATNMQGHLAQWTARPGCKAMPRTGTGFRAGAGAGGPSAGGAACVWAWAWRSGRGHTSRSATMRLASWASRAACCCGLSGHTMPSSAGLRAEAGQMRAEGRWGCVCGGEGAGPGGRQAGRQAGGGRGGARFFCQQPRHGQEMPRAPAMAGPGTISQPPREGQLHHLLCAARMQRRDRPPKGGGPGAVPCPPPCPGNTPAPKPGVVVQARASTGAPADTCRGRKAGAEVEQQLQLGRADLGHALGAVEPGAKWKERGGAGGREGQSAMLGTVYWVARGGVGVALWRVVA